MTMIDQPTTADTTNAELSSVLPTTAEAFVSFMSEIWDGTCRARPEGGLVLEGHPSYAEYHDAKKTLAMCGARRTGGTRVDGVHWELWRFQQDTSNGIRVNRDGSAIQLSTFRFSPKTKDTA